MSELIYELQSNGLASVYRVEEDASMADADLVAFDLTEEEAEQLVRNSPCTK